MTLGLAVSEPLSEAVPQPTLVKLVKPFLDYGLRCLPQSNSDSAALNFNRVEGVAQSAIVLD